MLNIIVRIIIVPMFMYQSGDRSSYLPKKRKLIYWTAI